jgi:SnoaL-like domain
MDADLQQLIDRQEIADLCVRYTFALDTKDWALLESCFTGAPSFVHPGGRPGGDTYIIAGSYTDTLARTSGGWKIAERVQVYLWRDGNRAVVSR